MHVVGCLQQSTGSAVGGTTLQGSAVGGTTLQGSAVGGTTLQGSAVGGTTLQGSAVGGTTLQGSAVGGTTLQGSAVGGPTLQGSAVGPLECSKMWYAFTWYADMVSCKAEMGRIEVCVFLTTCTSHVFAAAFVSIAGINQQYHVALSGRSLEWHVMLLLYTL